jgi:chromosomal replication initiation ATPase DnaA|tara:strand:+ start:4592 stop:4942 length:351 start_codon:yes stop_codon:yes gene_type:complete
VETKLKAYPDTPPESRRRLKLLTEAACEFWDIPREDLLGRSRKYDIVWPRSVCMVISQEAGYSSTATGKYFNRDHGTALHAKKTVSDLRDTREAYNQQYRQFVDFAKKYISKRMQP